MVLACVKIAGHRSGADMPQVVFITPSFHPNCCMVSRGEHNESFGSLGEAGKHSFFCGRQ
jgi:hypothetical protein